MSNFYFGLFWVSVYLALVLSPLVALLLGRVPAGNGFWWDFSLALGFAGTAMMGTLFLQTARFRRVAAPFGIDIVYYFHRQSSLFAFAFILIHPVILLSLEPDLWDSFRLSAENWPMWAGAGSLLALVLLLGSSLWRKTLHIHYDSWRVAHAVLACVALALAIVHILGVGYYVDAHWKKMIWGGITASWLLLLFYIRLIRPVLLLQRPYRVTGIRPERGDTWTLQLAPDGHAGFSFQPGQFAWLTIWSSPFALKEHPFSIASSAERSDRLEFSIKELGDFTARIKDVQIGQRVYVDGPYGSFSADREPASGFVFIAGGIGIAPIMGMLRTFADRSDSRPCLLIYAYNSWERLTFREELERLQDRMDLSLVTVLKDPPAGWQGEVGLVNSGLLERHLPEQRSSREYFICGPVAMLDLSERLLHELGVPMNRIHSELFDLV